MHDDQNTRKVVKAGTLVGRAFFICLTFLIIPLFIHSFFQYRTEIELERQENVLQEQDIRATLRAIGMQIAQRIDEWIALDWAILLSPMDQSALTLFHIRKMTIEAGLADQFVLIDSKRDELLVGNKTDLTNADVVVHQLADSISVKSPPFPIRIAVNEHLKDRFVEEIPVSKGGLFLCLATSYLGISHSHTDNFLLRIGVFIALVGLLGGGLVFLLLKKLAKPLNVLRSTMSRVAEGAVYSRYVHQQYGFEINAIGQYFNETMEALVAHQTQAENEKIQRERLAEKLQLAHTIQADLLPKKLPLSSHLDIGATYLPAMEVGGDFYDVFPLSNGKILLLVADIADKGISACLFSLGLRSSIRAIAQTNGGDLAELIKQANALFMLDSLETSQFATVWAAILDGKRLSYLSLGHPAAMLKREGTISELSTAHPSLGLFPFDEMTAAHIDLQSGDQLLIYSDGVTEAHDPDAHLFGKERLKAVFSKSFNGTAESTSGAILEEVQSFSQGAKQHDDVTILIVKVI